MVQRNKWNSKKKVDLLLINIVKMSVQHVREQNASLVQLQEDAPIVEEGEQ
jgi:hypothetical protein